MADPSQPKTPGQKPFAEFLKEAPRHQGGTVTLTGRVAQSDKEGHFVLDVGGGQTVELPTDSVHSYKVIDEAGKQVELQVHLKDTERKSIFQEQATAASIDQITLKELAQDTLKEAAKDPIHETLKEVSKDPVFDTVKEVFETLVEGGGTLAEGINNPGQQVGQPTAEAVPFTLAAAHQAPQNALALQGLTGQVKPLVQDVRTIASLDLQTTVKESIHDTLKEAHKDPILDTAKEVVLDTLKEVSKDPIHDTVKEVHETLIEGGGTLVEGGGTLVEGTGNPGGGNQF